MANEFCDAFEDTENYLKESVGLSAEITVTLFQSVELNVTVFPSSLHFGFIAFPASNTADFDTPETKYRHDLPLPFASIITSPTARFCALNVTLAVLFAVFEMSQTKGDTESHSRMSSPSTSRCASLQMVGLGTM